MRMPAGAGRLMRFVTRTRHPGSFILNGGGGGVKTLRDGWTVVTRDGSVSAHCEHTVAITADGPRVLTLGPGESWPPLPGAVGQ